MIAFIRVSPFIPTSGNPPFFADKFEMVKACNKSLCKAGDVRKVYLLDRCPDEWITYFKKYGDVFPNTYGKKESLWEAYRVAQLEKENILFLEDDYLWRPNTLKDLDKAVSYFGLVSPYDHPTDYLDDKNMIITYNFNGLTWRWCPTNTHTFAVKPNIFNEHIDAFYYGLHDWQMFFKLRTENVKLYTPLYSMATHLVTGQLAFNVDWEKLANKYKNG